MPAGRYFIDSPLTPGIMINLPDEENFHLVRVMRAELNEEVELINGKQVLATGVILAINKHIATIQVNSVALHQLQSPRFILCQAIPRLNRLEVILEKGTELGVNSFWLFPGDKSEKKGVNLKRAQTVVISALKQCGRLDLPTIELKPPLSQWKADTWQGRLYYGDTGHNTPFFLTQWESTATEIGFAVGPEGGFSVREIEILRAYGGIGVKLHRYVLRTDTASLVAMSLMQSWAMKY